MTTTSTVSLGTVSLDPFGNNNCYQSFRFFFKNEGGTFQHNISNAPLSPDSLGPDNATGVQSASATLANTPSGDDATTGFTSGVKISSATANRFIFDTADLDGATADVQVTLTDTSIGKDLHVRPSFISLNVNGTTRKRLMLDLFDESRTAVDINTTNFPAGKVFEVTAIGWMPSNAAP